jgi:predicted RNA-binding Zn-ribbon protein involved in translation (DUF1610 family)
MTFELPESMEELVYWTSRKIDGGHIKAWVEREDCPKCKKGLMGKPVEKGKVKVRAKYYECPECGFKMDKGDYEDTLSAKIIYTCPHCQHKGEIKVSFKRKKYKGVDSLIFECDSCGEKIPVTKKMKAI